MRPVNLPTDLLRAFVTVIDLGGFTKAGEVLGRTQPAVSLQMRRLEDLVGAKLIEIAGRRLKLTEAGELLALYAREILRLNDEAIAQFRKADAVGPLRVGLPTDYALAYLQSALTDFLAEHPDVELEIRCDLSQALLDQLVKDQLDVTVAIGGSATQHLVRSWVEQPIWVAAAAGGGHERSPVPLVAHPDGCEYRNRMIQALNLARREWRIAYSSPGITGLQEAVAAGLGMSALTGKTLRADMRVLGEPEGFPVLPEIRIGLYYKHPRLSDAGFLLVQHLVRCLDGAAGTNSLQPAAIKGAQARSRDH
jgi:DNA-binding transcriptional LysR family regulator